MRGGVMKQVRKRDFFPGLIIPRFFTAIFAAQSRQHVFLHLCMQHFAEEIFKEPRNRFQGIDSKESVPPAYVSWRAGTATLFLLGSYSCYKIPSLFILLSSLVLQDAGKDNSALHYIYIQNTSVGARRSCLCPATDHG